MIQGMEKNLPQVLTLLSEMNMSTQNVSKLVDNMLRRVRRGELSTDQGLSFLEVKYNMLLSYLINLSFVVLRKCSGEHISGDPCIDRLIELRTVLEKMRPIDSRLKYQIDKLVKGSMHPAKLQTDPTVFKPNPDDLEAEQSSGSEADGGAATKKYVPPKMTALPYTGDETALERGKKRAERSKRLALSSAIVQDLKEEYLDTPVEISQSNRAQQALSKEQQERQAYEETYMTRLPLTKAQKHQRRHLTTMGSLGEEVTAFKNAPAAAGKRKKKQSGKKRSFKRRKMH